NLSKEYNVALVATGDCHYVNAHDREAHEVMLAIQTHDRMDNPERYTFGECRVHMRTTQEMLNCFPQHEEAIWNAGKIADRCTFQFPTGKLFFHQYQIPESETQESYFKKLCLNGFSKLYEKNRFPRERYDVYLERLNIEMD